ncbi:MAG: hypothetical protein R6W91_05765 [Thermoplasmata archaeon]
MILAIAMALVPVSAVALGSSIEVPESGYSGTDTLLPGEDNIYDVHVKMNHDLLFTFHVVGQGDIMVFLIPMDDPANIRYYTSQPVTEYTVRLPAIIGFDKGYSILVNTSYPGEIQYNAEIHTEVVEHPEYSLYYILIILGFVALVVFCWKFVVWQDKRERTAKKADREARRGKRRK